MIAHKSKRLQAAADKKSMDALFTACDWFIDPNQIFSDTGGTLGPNIDVLESIHEAFLRGMQMADLVHTRNSKASYMSPRKHIYLVTIRNAMGEATFFFVGTVNSIMDKLDKYEDI